MLIIFDDYAKNVEEINGFFKKNGNYTVTDITCFTQTWSSTALGFGGIGGQALTPAVTTIITFSMPKGNYKTYVFFGGHFAYYVDEQNDAFREDVNRKFMGDVETALERYGAVDKV